MTENPSAGSGPVKWHMTPLLHFKVNVISTDNAIRLLTCIFSVNLKVCFYCMHTSIWFCSQLLS